MTKTNAGEDAEKLDHLDVTGGNVKWHGRSGQQFGSLL